MGCFADLRKGVKKRCGLMLLFLWAAMGLNAQSPRLKYLGIEKGLSNNSVRCIYQDHQGFMWFGTYDGLNRYDGYEFTVFRNRLDDSASLPYNYINVIKEDRRHQLWVGTGQGIGLYNPLSAKWQTAFYIPYGQKSKEKIQDNINHIETDVGGRVFIATANEGLLLTNGKDNLAWQVPCRSRGGELTNYTVPALKTDEKGRVWVFVEGVGLGRYNDKSRRVEVLNHTLSSIQCLEGRGDSLWLGTKNGLLVYDIITNHITPHPTNASPTRALANITSLFLDKQRSIWIGTESDGVKIVNTLTGEVVSILPGDEKNNITSGSVNALFEDRESRKWIGTLKGGINIIDPEETRFQTIAHEQRNPNSLINDFVYSFYEDKEKNLWVGTDGGGFSIWNRKQNSFTHNRHNGQQKNTLSNNSVTSMLQDHLGQTWIATYGGGINRFYPATGSFERYPCINDQTGEENKTVMVLYEDRRNELWAGTFANGRLYRFNRTKDRFEVFDHRIINLLSMTEDKSGNLWVGNTGQLIRIEPTRKSHVAFTINKPVRAIHEDKKGAFWIGTEGGGLLLFDRKKGQVIRRFSVENGLCNNSILKILEDDKGQLWLSTFNGLSRFTPGEAAFKNYYQSDGLQSNQFLFRSGLRLSSGELVFGGIRGFNLFYPDSIQPRTYLPPVVFTNLHINGKPVAEAFDFVQKTSGDKIEALRIPYDEAVLSVDFAALEYSSPDRIAYAYFLEGWDKDWHYSRNVRTANYSHLSEGTYFLRVKATNAEGTWNSAERVVKITVLPPWYRTAWAYLFYLLLVASLVYLYLRYKTRQTKLEYEVKLAHLETEKEKELNEKKLSFFTDVSHEFRTPLTLIINPLKDFLQTRGAASPELNVVYRNARRLLSLVDQLLLFQKADAEREGLKITQLNFSQLCKDVFGSFGQGARAKNIRYEFEADSEAIFLYADKEKIEIVLYNLLSNALKFTPEGGLIRFGLAEGAAEVEVVVTDSGPGIPEEIGDRLFERFYQAKGANTTSKPGFGIGLYLVKHFVEKHRGQISYRSRPGAGTAFTILLKKGVAHLEGETILETLPQDTLLPELVAEEAVAPPTGKKELDEITSAKGCILVVEDDDDIRRYIRSVFSEAFTVYEANSGTAGLRLAKEMLPDLIISDVMMQDGNGLELCQAVKSDPELGHVPVILLTAASSPELKLQGVEGGADDYITKPFEKDLLVARVATLLKNRSALQQYFYNEITLRKNDLKISPEYKAFLDRCIQIVESHLEDDDFNIKKLAQEIGMSHSNLYRKVKIISGQSVSSFIRFLRVRKAAELMLTSNLNVNEASFQVGISDVKYFRRHFQKLFGMNPSEYIKRYRRTFSDAYTVNKAVISPDE